MKKLFFALMMGLALAACTPEAYDDTAIKEQIDNLDDRLTKVEEDLATLELNVDALKTLTQALKDGKYIESVVALEDETGYTITFSDGSSIVIKNGEKGEKGDTGAAGAAGATGAAGQDGVTPTITVKEIDGVLYWFINGEQGPAVYEEAPVFTSVDGNLYVTYPGGEPQFIGALTGKSIFDSVVVNEEEGTVTFYFIGENGEAGDSFVLPLAEKFALEIDATVGLSQGQTSVEIPYTVKGANETTVVDVLAVACEAVVEAEVIKVSNIAAGAQLLVFADNGEGKTSIKKVTFSTESYSVENVDEVIPAEGGSVVVKGISNVAFDVVIPAEATWLSYVEVKSAFELTFTAEANTADTSREAVVNFVRQGTEEVLMSVTIAQAAGKAMPKELKRVWGKYAPDADGWIVMGAGNLDRGMAMDNQYIYISKSTAYAPVIKAFDFAGNEAFDCDVTGMGSGNAWGDAMQYSVNCVRTMPKADGSYVLIACNLKLDGTQILQIWAWVDGPQAAPTCIGRYQWDTVANANDHRRYGDRFDVKGTWEEGELWFPSMQDDDHGKTIVFKTFDGVDASNRPSKYYRMEPSRSNMKDLAFYPGYDEVFSTCNGNAKFVKLDGTTHATGWVNWAVTDDFTTDYTRTCGYNFFEVDGKKYIAYVKVDEQNGRTGRLVVLEDETSDFKAALNAKKVAWEFPLQHESDFAAASAASTGNTLGNCKVVTVDGVTYIGAHIQGLGCSLFKFE